MPGRHQKGEVFLMNARMIVLILRLSLAILGLAGTTSSAWGAGPEDSIVRVTSVLRPPSALRPWAKQDPIELGGTGVVIDGKQILTVAHLVT
jgi:hypothetical protein